MSTRKVSGYDQNGNPGGIYSMSNPPPGKRFGAFVNGGRSIQWAPALSLVRLSPTASDPLPSFRAAAAG